MHRTAQAGRMRSGRMLMLALGCACTVLAGCSAEVSVGGATIDKQEIEKQIFAGATEQAGTKPKDVSCPDDVDAEKGAKTECTLTAPDGNTAPVAVTITQADTDTGTFNADWEVRSPQSQA